MAAVRGVPWAGAGRRPVGGRRIPGGVRRAGPAVVGALGRAGRQEHRHHRSRRDLARYPGFPLRRTPESPEGRP